MGRRTGRPPLRSCLWREGGRRHGGEPGCRRHKLEAAGGGSPSSGPRQLTGGTLLAGGVGAPAQQQVHHGGGAGHLEWGLAFSVALLGISSIPQQQLHHLQEKGRGEAHQGTAVQVLSPPRPLGPVLAPPSLLSPLSRVPPSRQKAYWPVGGQFSGAKGAGLDLLVQSPCLIPRREAAGARRCSYSQGSDTRNPSRNSTRLSYSPV